MMRIYILLFYFQFCVNVAFPQKNVYSVEEEKRIKAFFTTSNNLSNCDEDLQKLPVYEGNKSKGNCEKFLKNIYVENYSDLQKGNLQISIPKEFFDHNIKIKIQIDQLILNNKKNLATSFSIVNLSSSMEYYEINKNKVFNLPVDVSNSIDKIDSVQINAICIYGDQEKLTKITKLDLDKKINLGDECYLELLYINNGTFFYQINNPSLNDPTIFGFDNEGNIYNCNRFNAGISSDRATNYFFLKKYYMNGSSQNVIEYKLKSTTKFDYQFTNKLIYDSKVIGLGFFTPVKKEVLHYRLSYKSKNDKLELIRIDNSIR